LVNGLEAFGFTSPPVQALLRAAGAPTGEVDAPPAQLEPGQAVGAWAPAAAAAAPGDRPTLAQLLQRAVAGAAPAPAPSLHFVPGSQPNLQLQLAAGVFPRSPHPRAAPRAAPAVTFAEGGLTPGAHAAALAGRPASRSRRRTHSAQGAPGKGWTAFTAYGMETREAVRQEHPWASASDVEKVRRPPKRCRCAQY
jgi:hypothetical protein